MNGTRFRLIDSTRVLAAVAAFSATTWIAAQFAYGLIFSWFAEYDDEGYLLISLKVFRQGHALYDSVYSQYGPFYYEFMDLLLSVLGKNVTHDAGRLITVGIWTVTSLLCGLLVYGLTRNLWIGGSVHLMTALALDTLRNEPMHPGGLVCLLLGGIVILMLLMPARPRLTWILLGALGTALMLTKINVGIFALLAIAFAALGTAAHTRLARVLLALAGAFIFFVPLLLMMAKLGEPWVSRYAIHIMAAILPLVLLEVVGSWRLAVGSGAADSTANRPLPTANLFWAICGGAGTLLVVVAVLMLRGTTLSALVNAVFIAPLRQADVLTIPLAFAAHSRKLALLAALAGVAAVLWKRSEEGFRWGGELAGFLRIAAGLAMWTAAPNLFPGRLGFFFAPLAWVAALPVPGISDPPALAFARRLLPLLAVLQTLHAYPVAVSQIQWGAFLLIPVAAICLVDGGRQLGRSIVLPEKLPIVASAAAVLVFFAVGAETIRKPLKWAKTEYANKQPLGLPGSERVRLWPPQVAELQSAVALLQDPRCQTFFTGPGLGSFYFWTRREPPTGFNATLWVGLFDAATQRRVIRELDRVDRLCVLQKDGLIAFWGEKSQFLPSPLCEYLMNNFVAVRKLDRYDLMVRRRKSGTP